MDQIGLEFLWAMMFGLTALWRGPFYWGFKTWRWGLMSPIAAGTFRLLTGALSAVLWIDMLLKLSGRGALLR